MVLVAAAVGTAALVAVAPPTSAAAGTGYTVIDNREDCTLATIDLATGQLTPFPTSSEDSCVQDLAVAPDGTVWGILSPKTIDPIAIRLVRFDAVGAPTIVPLSGNFTEAFGADGGLAFDKAGNLLTQLVTDEPGCDTDFVCLYRTDPTTGASTFIGNSTLEGEVSMAFLAADCSGNLRTAVEEGRDEGCRRPRRAPRPRRRRIRRRPRTRLRRARAGVRSVHSCSARSCRPSTRRPVP